MLMNTTFLIRALIALHRLWSRLESLCAGLAGTLIAIAMFLTVTEVVSRKLLNYPLPGIIDMFDLGMAAIAFLGASQCQRLGKHVRMEMLIRFLPKRAFWFFEFLTNSLALVFVVSISAYSYKGFLRSIEMGDTTMDLMLPVWPSKLLIAFALCILGGRLLLQSLDSLRLMENPNTSPVCATPLTSVINEISEYTESVPDNSGSKTSLKRTIE